MEQESVTVQIARLSTRNCVALHHTCRPATQAHSIHTHSIVCSSEECSRAGLHCTAMHRAILHRTGETHC